MDVRAELEPLLDGEVDEILPPDLRVAGDVVDVLLGIDRSDLATELTKALDDADARVTVPGVVRGREADRACADDGDVADSFAHACLDATRGEETLVRAAGAATAACMRLHGLALGHVFLRLEGRAAPARRLHVRVVDGEAGAHERVHVVDLGAGQIGRAERIDDDAHPVHLDLVVAVLRPAVETEGVLEARAAAALDGD